MDNEGNREWEALGPLLHGRTIRSPDEEAGSEWGIRPFLSHTRRADGSRHTTEVLWPLGRFHRTPSSWSDWLVPVFWHRGNTHPDRAGMSLFVFPFFFQRRGPPGDGVAVFPFYGDMKKFMGMDELKFIFFPVYIRTRGSQGISHHVLWPFFGWGSGENAWWGRAFPFFSRSVQDRHHDDHVYLWPFLTLTKDLEYTDRPRSGFMAWPFFGTLSRDQAYGWSVLYPLFSAYEDRKQKKGVQNLPYPFFHSWWGPDGKGWFAWPFHGSYTSTPTRTGSFLRSRFYLWPLVWDREFAHHGTHHRTFHIQPILTVHSWAGEQGTGKRVAVFPLFEWKGEDDGTGKLAVGSLLPLPMVNDAIHEQWGVFFSPYIRWAGPGRRIREQSILGLFRRYEAPDFSRWTLPVLYSGRWSRTGTLHQFLLGTVRIEAEATGNTRLRLLGIPIPLSGSHVGTPPPREEEDRP